MNREFRWQRTRAVVRPAQALNPSRTMAVWSSLRTCRQLLLSRPEYRTWLRLTNLPVTRRVIEGLPSLLSAQSSQLDLEVP